MEKTIMILGANTLQLPLITKARELNYKVIVVSPDKHEPGFIHADICVYLDVRDKKAVLNAAKEYSVDGIITDQTDLPVRTAAYVADKLELPGIGYDTACLFTDKYQMREKCKTLGIKTLQYKFTTTLEEAVDFFESLHHPVILKPVDNQGSKGVYKVESTEQLVDKYCTAQSFSQKGILVEEFVSGSEFVVEGYALNYEFHNLICGDTFYFDIPDVFSATTRIFPSTRNPVLVEKVLDMNQKIITGFGLKQGITHSEFIVCNDDIYLIETAARGGGVFISSDLISLSTGLETEKFLLDIATDPASANPVVTDKSCVCCYVAFFLPVGIITSADGINLVRALPYTHRDNFDTLYVGKKTTDYSDKTSRYFIIVEADTHEELEKRVEHIKQNLNIIVQTTDGSCGPIWE